MFLPCIDDAKISPIRQLDPSRRTSIFRVLDPLDKREGKDGLGQLPAVLLQYASNRKEIVLFPELEGGFVCSDHHAYQPESRHTRAGPFSPSSMSCIICVQAQGVRCRVLERLAFRRTVCRDACRPDTR